jgi:hypothetical protein
MRAAFIFHFLAIFCWRGRLLAFLLFGFLAVKPAMAINSWCAEPVFGVSNISIDQRAETASIARDIGVRKAAEQAFSTVLGRILLTNDAQHKFMSLHDLDDFSDFIHIVEENNLDQRYIATLDFCFDAARLRQAMITAQLSWSELQSPPILVIPVWSGPDGARAWQRDNQWIAGWWDAVAAYDGLLSFRQLERNLINERQFRGEDLVLANPAKLRNAASLVRAEQVLLVAASLDYEGSKPLVTITARLFDKTGQMISDILYGDQKTLENFTVNDLDIMRRKIIERMDESWQMANLIDDSETGHITVFLPVKSLKEWAKRLTALDEIAVIQSYDIITLDTRGGQLYLRLAGSQKALQNALSAHRLQLVEHGDRQLISAKPENS